MTFEIKNEFYLNNEPFKIISGSIHYFRTVPEYWQDRLEKLKNIGCNTVETYIPWNFHEENRGEFRFNGMRDIERFIQLAKELDLYMIIRPSPYICAEWEFGGLPAWLLKDRNMRLRCSYEPYINAVRDYYKVLIPKLVPYQIDRGGNIIMIQIENEYGYYGNDTGYLEFLRDTMRGLGITVPFATSDGPWNENIFKSGMVNGALPTGNFGSGAEWQFGQMKKFIGENKPMMCMEFWDGWFDAWGEEHHTTSPEKAAAELDELLKRGSINFYMFEGGTNFGFMSGRNSGNKTCDVTSYDYDAPLTEDGRITEKYIAFKNIISKYSVINEVPLTTEIKRRGYGKISCTAKADLFSVLDKIAEPIHSLYPLTMEDIGQNYGYILYQAKLRPDEAMNDIYLEGAADRAQCYHNGDHVGTFFGDNIWSKIEISEKNAGGYVQVLVENLGRENFGTGLENQRKGISGSIKVNDHRCYGIDIFPLPLSEEQIGKIDFDSGYSEGKPAFYKFEFEADELCDTFVDFDGFGKGNIFINGFNLGRFWDIGPQKTLYLPAPLLKRGNNTIIIFETEGRSSDSIMLTDEHNIG
ncbi:MAG: beta-galactosidase [Oscillospiraceae bacterium]|nr:beta-galactosidase [Oscillospiraceae bacterium]